MNICGERTRIGDRFIHKEDSDTYEIIKKRQQRYGSPIVITKNTRTNEVVEVGEWKLNECFRHPNPKRYFVSYAFSGGFGSCVFMAYDEHLNEEYFSNIQKQKIGKEVVILYFRELTDNEADTYLKKDGV